MQTAAQNLRVDDATARVLRALEHEGVASILLKGPSTVRWLYRDRPRRYSDCDLLVPPDTMRSAERALDALGFAPELERLKMPAWWREHAVAWLDGELVVDLHGTLVGVGVDEHRLWELLSARVVTMDVGGFPATVLAPSGRAMHVALQAAQDGDDKGDLARALSLSTEETWREAAALARALRATSAFAAGLRLLTEGRLLAERLELPRDASVGAILKRSAAPQEALTFELLRSAAGPRQRVAILTRKLFPPPTFIRHWARLESRSRAALALAYARRLVWVAGKAPAAFRAWRGARREARRA